MPFIEWTTGVYAIQNRLNGKVYVGGAYKSFSHRFRIHLRDLRASRHPNEHLQSAWNKYGPRSFAWKIIEKCHPSICEDRETYWIAALNSTDRRFGYNKSPTGGSPLGTKHPPEYGAAVAERNRKRNSDPEVRGRVLRAVAEARSCVTAASREKQSAALRGRKRPAEVVEKIASILRGKKRSAEARENITRANRSRVNTPELRYKMGSGNRGRKQPPEEIARRSAALREAYRRKREGETRADAKQGGAG